MTVRFEDDVIHPEPVKPRKSAGRLATEWGVFALVVGLAAVAWLGWRPIPDPGPGPAPVPIPTPTPTPKPDPLPVPVPPKPDPEPAPDPVSAWTQIGRTFGTRLRAEYAACWRTLATEVEAGRDMVKATQAMAKEWQDRRANLFRETLTPELAKVQPEGTEPTADQRRAMGKAYRELADGLEGK